MTTFFCDGLKEVTILNGVARLEFHRLQPSGQASAGPNRDVQTITELFLAMPVHGFLQAMNVLDQVREQLIKEGMLKPTDSGAASEPRPAPARPDRSPNFS